MPSFVDGGVAVGARVSESGGKEGKGATEALGEGQGRGEEGESKFVCVCVREREERQKECARKSWIRES